tara:strand:+ start:1035 stop:2234 length:1200 start_codon:yes stop_codon:yes gene_type:complete
MFINYPLFHILLMFGTDPVYQNLGLRLFASTLCLPLILIDKLSTTRFKRFIPIYWQFTVMICLPFFFTFMTLKNGVSTIWLMNSMSAIFFMLLVMDILSFLGNLITGICLGFTFFYLTSDTIVLNPGVVSIPGVLSTFGAALIIGGLFSYNKTKREEHKRKSLEAIGTIAHEMRTPLLNITLCGNLMDRSIKNLEKMTPPDKETERDTLDKDINLLKEISKNLVEMARGTNNVISLLLSNLKQDFSTIKTEPLSIKKVLDETIKSYAFKGNDFDKVNVEIVKDFTIFGNQKLLVHVFFNLLRNSLYFIHAAGKGEVFITVKTKGPHNVVIFRDTGPGIKNSDLHKLFKPFFTNSPNGTGIGLSFCKKVIENLKGTIKVDSAFGKHTTFIITFPQDNTDR